MDNRLDNLVVSVKDNTSIVVRIDCCQHIRTVDLRYPEVEGFEVVEGRGAAPYYQIVACS